MNWARTAGAHGELIFNLVSRDLKSRYKGSFLGFLWTILTPLFMAAIYVFFLRLIVGRGVPIEEIIIGVFAWQFTMQCVNNGMMSVTGNSNLVKKVTFPRIILPLSSVLANLVNYLLSLLVQFGLIGAMLLLHGTGLSGWIWTLPFLIAFQLLFNVGLALLLSSANVYFRDTQHLVGVLTSAWFFVSPVMYNLSFVDQVAGQHPWIGPLFMLNPMSVIITAYRSAILPGIPFPATGAAGISAAAVLLFVLLSYALFQKTQRYFSDML